MSQFLCELCFDAYTPHVTDAWDGLPTAVCDDCLAPPVLHPAWGELWHPAAMAQIRATYEGPVVVPVLEWREYPQTVMVFPADSPEAQEAHAALARGETHWRGLPLRRE